MTTSLAERPELEAEILEAKQAIKAAARILGLCNNLENMRREFLERLPQLEDDVIIAVRMGARAVSVWAWVVEAACDFEMMARVGRLKGGRGNKDELNEGRLATMRQQGYLDGKAPRTIERNVQIVETFGLETIATHGDTLQEKGYWIAAVSAPDPLEAIETLAEKKANEPFMEVQEAYRVIDELNGKHAAAKDKFIDVFRTIARKDMGMWIRFTARPAIEQLRASCPDPKLTKFWMDMDNQLQEREDAMLIEDAGSALFYAWDKGYRTEPQMCDFTGLLPLEIRTALLSLQERGYFVEQPQQWKPSNARGSRVKEWVRTAKPLPSLHVVSE